MIATAWSPPGIAPTGTAGLDRRLDRVCGLVDAHLDVVLDDDSDRAAAAACDVARFARHLAMHGVRVGWARGIGARLVPRLRGPGVVQRLLWTPSRAGQLGAGHALLRALGHPAPAWDDVIDRLVRHPLDGRALSPHQALELDWVLGLLDREPRSGPRAPDGLEGAIDPLTMVAADAHAYTRTVWYATDFGRRALPAPQVDAVGGRCDAGAAWSVARGDLELAGGFILAALCAGAPLGASARLALAALLTTWDELGFVPDDAMAGRGATQPRDERFYAIQHANLVAGMVVATLRATWSDLAAEPAIPARGRDAEALIAALAEQTPAPRAAAIVAALPARWHARAAADLALHQAMRRRDLCAVVRALTLAARIGEPSATDRAARAWLDEVAATVVALALPGARELASLTRGLHAIGP